MILVLKDGGKVALYMLEILTVLRVLLRVLFSLFVIGVLFL